MSPVRFHYHTDARWSRTIGCYQWTFWSHTQCCLLVFQKIENVFPNFVYDFIWMKVFESCIVFYPIPLIFWNYTLSEKPHPCIFGSCSSWRAAKEVCATARVWLGKVVSFWLNYAFPCLPQYLHIVGKSQLALFSSFYASPISFMTICIVLNMLHIQETQSDQHGRVTVSQLKIEVLCVWSTLIRPPTWGSSDQRTAASEGSSLQELSEWCFPVHHRRVPKSWSKEEEGREDGLQTFSRWIRSSESLTVLISMIFLEKNLLSMCFVKRSDSFSVSLSLFLSLSFFLSL